MQTLMSLRSMTSSNESDEDPALAAACDGDEILLDPNRFVQRSQWVPHSARKQCLVCARDFTLWRKKHTCRMCGDVVCSRCSMHKRVDLPLIENKFRVCTCCFFAYRQGLKPTAPSTLRWRNDDIRAELLAMDTTTVTKLTPDATVLYEPAPVLLYDPALDDECTMSRPGSNECDDSSDASMTLDDILDEEDAAMNARELELEAQVQASRLRVQELESKIALQASKQDLTLQQQHELQEARKLIVELTRQLKAQEDQVQLRMTFRESLCVEPSTQRSRRMSGPTPQQRLKEDLQLSTDTVKLRRRLQKMERQLKQAGINVAEDIPYDEAKEKVAEISARLQEIGSSEIVCDDKQLQAALRKEYFRLEQDMERYNTALMMTDEYMEAERQKELQWELQHCATNEAALRQLRCCMPVNLSVLTEKDLSACIGPDLAKKLKRTNVLQLLRVDPKTITRMHPSVIEAYRLTGLSVLERRALHVVLATPAAEWKKQATSDELSARKLAWFKKLHDALVDGIGQLELHKTSTHDCGRRQQCPAVVELKAEALYTRPTSSVPYPADAVYFVQDVVKSDPDGAGEKALAEVRNQILLDRRQKELKAHYGNLRLVTQALGAMDDLDAALSRFATAEAALVQRQCLDQWSSLLLDARDVVLSMAKRSGMHLSGKRDPSKDDSDPRATVEVHVAMDVLHYVEAMLEEIELALLVEPTSGARTRIVAQLKAVRDVSSDLGVRNRAIAPTYSEKTTRLSWKQLQAPDSVAVTTQAPTAPTTTTAPSTTRPAVSFLDEIKAKKASAAKAPVDMLAAIKARRHSKPTLLDVPNSA
ncbi:hypothetical protein SDRG_02683 [Saprolegnia diclina VS20]|uniref:FYVE-type domain-containing protein n=1 Tax=Saprolegnia diclina (strain VS20) TaxID=1156394 RepID=T0QPJ6_SAPDV|nr:hypothetical protein SDRG_02683 [Saprolegnia diclina VS20]EQC40024.1 hypothetical protein SDRG_02683 [Saprolegnia diclina VS20]|eukprot:XP_008606498.1 hypothetical protein SDRG_02683 [Saprolegnia diclina VS20]